MTEKELYHYGILGMRWGKRKGDRYHEDYKNAHSGKSYKAMSNKELSDTNKRLNLEANYHDLRRKTSRGKRFADAFVAGATTVAAVGVAAVTYKKLGNKIVDRIANSKLIDFSNIGSR